MDFSYLLEHRHYEPERLRKAGFEERSGIFSLKRPFADPNFYGIIRIGEGLFEIKVYETSFDEEYIPFTLKTVQSPLVAGLREQVNDWINTLLSEDFDQNDAKEKLLAYAQEKYHSPADHPFDEKPYERSTVLRVKEGGKWYALFMGVPAKCLSFPDESDIQIVNLKESEKTIETAVDNLHVFPAYHMNKKYWVTLLLDPTMNLETAKALLDESYTLVSAKKKTKK
jgi:predicted DNA-binding protein (MmcQ/YjbR family)